MVLNKIYISEENIERIDKIKELKLLIDDLCSDIVLNCKNDGVDTDTVQDIMFESGVYDIAGKLTVNRLIKNTYKLEYKLLKSF